MYMQIKKNGDGIIIQQKEDEPYLMNDRMNRICILLIILVIIVIMVLEGCNNKTFPESFDPTNAGATLDEAAVNCLDWAWFYKSYVNEVGGGLIKTPEGYACVKLTVGTPLSVTSYVFRNWVAHFHTHSRSNTQVSKQDMYNVREDPQHRPSYIRLQTGTVIAYECRRTNDNNKNKNGKKVKCAGRRVIR